MGDTRKPGRRSTRADAKRELAAKRYVYFWATASMYRLGSKMRRSICWSSSAPTPEGKKVLVGLIGGMRESTQSWKELLLDLKRRGLSRGPELAVADGALGSWQAVEEVPTIRGQRCW